ncbi:OmpA family protein [Sphingobacterium faecale]|uniref:OmpA family protein n=1 Tax=Sphingobacterium faecale TaxID=2803775 RepID=A0ABS1R1D9_9SPHI|nr:OmpA family protein [Sphingobacterium faecale]MBL1407711.1 OmpA family protein [Sphingobacterium faecale]
MKYNRIFLSHYLVLALMLFGPKLYAQEQRSVQEKADLLFDKYEYYNAAKLYSKLSESKKIKTRNLERLAESYAYINNYDLAENWYARAVQRSDYAKRSLLVYATVLKENGKYAEAKAMYKRYTDEQGDDDFVKLALQGADSAIRWIANPKKVDILPFTGVNGPLSEFAMMSIENKLYYVGETKDATVAKSGMTGESFLRLFSRDSNSSGKGSIATDGNINQAKYHVGPIASNKSGNRLYVTRTNPSKEVQKYRKEGRKWSRATLELMIYDKEGDGWKETAFPFNNVKEYSLGHAAWSEDENRLYFASDMPGGKGGVDIWFCELRSDGTWANPVNVGAEVNSPYDEMFPMVFGSKLYFSSNGKPGMGGLDIFEAILKGGKAIKVKNMGFPINSASDDFAYFVQDDDDKAQKGFLSSNRTGGLGGDDIYTYATKKPVFKIVIEGKTFNKKSKKLLAETNVTLYGAKRNLVAKTQSNGSAEFTFDADNNATYKILAERSGFHADSIDILTTIPTKDTIYQVALYLEPVMEVGHKFVLEDIYYDFDKYNIRKDAAVILDQLVRTLRDNPTLRIELSSHTDSRGSHRYNDVLSQRRAESAVAYIVSRGIERDRLVAKGYGERRLVNRCADGVKCSPTEHQANRRTEVEILSY